MDGRQNNGWMAMAGLAATATSHSDCAEDAVEDADDLGGLILGATGPYSHFVRRVLQARHDGRASSHFTLRNLQFAQPRRDFLCARFGTKGASEEASSDMMTHRPVQVISGGI